MLRIAAKMGLVLALFACGGKQAEAPATNAASPSAEAPVASPSSPPSDTPAAATTTVPSDAPAATTTVPSDSPPVDTSSDTTAAPPPAPGSGTGKTAAALTAEAQTAGKASQWGKALNLAEQALRASPDSSTKLSALSVAALAACNLKNLAKAKQYHAQLPASRQLLIRQRCLANGVTVTP